MNEILQSIYNQSFCNEMEKIAEDSELRKVVKAIGMASAAIPIGIGSGAFGALGGSAGLRFLEKKLLRSGGQFKPAVTTLGIIAPTILGAIGGGAIGAYGANQLLSKPS